MRGHAHKGLQVTVGQLYLLGRDQPIEIAGPCEYSASAAIPASSDYAGPCASLGSSSLWASTGCPL